mgnify:CR=1 FL=1
MKDSSKNPTVGPSSTKPTASSSAKPRVAAPEKGKLVKKKNTAAGDPTKMAKPSRTKVLATSGATYGVRVKFQKSTAPEAGAIQSNGRILPPAMKAQAPNFSAGMADHN